MNKKNNVLMICEKKKKCFTVKFFFRFWQQKSLVVVSISYKQGNKTIFLAAFESNPRYYSFNKMPIGAHKHRI